MQSNRLPFTLRNLMIEDVRIVTKLSCECVQIIYPDEFIKELIESENYVKFGYFTHDNGLIGHVIACLDVSKECNTCEYLIREFHNSCFISLICVKEEYRKCGIGTKLIDKLKEICKQKSLDSIGLHSYVHNRVANGFYKKLGFCKVAIQKDFYKNCMFDDEPTKDAFIQKLDLRIEKQF